MLKIKIIVQKRTNHEQIYDKKDKSKIGRENARWFTRIS